MPFPEEWRHVGKAGGRSWGASSMPHLLLQQLFITSKHSFVLCCCWRNFLFHLLMLWWTCRPLHRLLFYPCLLRSCFGKRERAGKGKTAFPEQTVGRLLGWGLMLLAGSQQDSVEPVTETDDGMLKSVSWNGSGPGEEECFPHQQSLLSPSLRVGSWAMAAWWSVFFVFMLHIQSLWARGCSCHLWDQLQNSHWSDDGSEPSILNNKKFLHRWECMWLFDKILFPLNGNASVRGSTTINHWIHFLLCFEIPYKSDYEVCKIRNESIV